MKKPKWWNNEIQNSLSLKKRVYSRYISTRSEADKLELGRILCETKKLMKRSKKNLEEYIAETSKSHPKEFFSYVSNKKSLTCGIGPLANDNGNHTNDENEMATILNNFFASIFTDEDCLSPQPPFRTEKILSGVLIVESDILRTIEKINVSKAPGPDKITPRVLKETKPKL